MSAYEEGIAEIAKNPEQRRAIEATGNIVLLAGPGSGKTKVLSLKVAKTLRGLEAPKKIACITYSNECAGEIERRLDTLGANLPERTFLGTVHAFFYSCIIVQFADSLQLSHQIRVASDAERSSLFRQALRATVGVDEDPRRWEKSCENYRKEHWERKPGWEVGNEQAAAVIEAYEGLLHAGQLVDFDGMVILALRLIARDPDVMQFLEDRFPFIFIDEYQDLGVPLHAFVTRLRASTGIVFFIVGDPDQSIYGFNGARPELLREISQSEGCEAIIPRMNYRCPAKIVNLSLNALGEKRIYKATSAVAGSIVAHRIPGAIPGQATRLVRSIIPDYFKQHPERKLGDIGILYPTKAVGSEIEQAFREAGLAYIRADGGVPYLRAPLTRFIEALAGYCSQPHPPALLRLRASYARLFYGDRRYDRRWGTELVAWAAEAEGWADLPLREWLARAQQGPLMRVLSDQFGLDHAQAFSSLQVAAEEELTDATVRSFGFHRGSSVHATLTTLHSAKGLEFDMVAMVGLDEGILPGYYEYDDPARIAESRRLFYVGVTRSLNELNLLYSGFRVTSWGKQYRDGPSRFLVERGRDFDRHEQDEGHSEI